MFRIQKIRKRYIKHIERALPNDIYIYAYIYYTLCFLSKLISHWNVSKFIKITLYNQRDGQMGIALAIQGYEDLSLCPQNSCKVNPVRVSKFQEIWKEETSESLETCIQARLT